MVKYQYKAKKSDAQTVFGHVIAANQEEAIDQVNQMGLIPIAIEEAQALPVYRGSIRSKKVRNKDIFIFSKQLISLLKAGVPILRALEIIVTQMRHLYFQSIIEAIRVNIRGGRSFSESLAEHPSVFSSLYVTMVKVGEESGRLTECVMEIAEYQRRQEEITTRIRSAMAYPLFMACFGLLTLAFLVIYVMPRIEGLFSHLNQSLPAVTLLTLRLSALFSDWRFLLAIMIGSGLIIGFAQRYMQTPAGKLTLSRIELKLPGLSRFLIKVEMARFARTMELLLKSGVPIVKALQLSIPLSHNEVIKEHLKTCERELLGGRSFGASLKRSRYIPDMMGHLIVVGEAGGKLAESLHDVAEEYDQETYDMIKGALVFIEPVMILLVGSVIGFFVISMLLPVFDLNVFGG